MMELVALIALAIAFGSVIAMGRMENRIEDLETRVEELYRGRE